jgi:hypothetical protein
MLSAIYAESLYAECQYVECRYAECHVTQIYQSRLKLASGSNMVVENWTYYPKIKGSTPAAGTGREKMAKKLALVTKSYIFCLSSRNKNYSSKIFYSRDTWS